MTQISLSPNNVDVLGAITRQDLMEVQHQAAQHNRHNLAPLECPAILVSQARLEQQARSAPMASLAQPAKKVSWARLARLVNLDRLVALVL